LKKLAAEEAAVRSNIEADITRAVEMATTTKMLADFELEMVAFADVEKGHRARAIEQAESTRRSMDSVIGFLQANVETLKGTIAEDGVRYASEKTQLLANADCLLDLERQRGAEALASADSSAQAAIAALREELTSSTTLLVELESALKDALAAKAALEDEISDLLEKQQYSRVVRLGNVPEVSTVPLPRLRTQMRRTQATGTPNASVSSSVPQQPKSVPGAASGFSSPRVLSDASSATLSPGSPDVQAFWPMDTMNMSALTESDSKDRFRDTGLNSTGGRGLVGSRSAAALASPSPASSVVMERSGRMTTAAYWAVEVSELKADLSQTKTDLVQANWTLSTTNQTVIRLTAELKNSTISIDVAARRNNRLSQDLEVMDLELQEAKTLAAPYLRIRSAPNDPKVIRGATALQAVVRGCLSRVRTRELFLQKIAAETGTLVAKRDTVQGDSGWYTGPDRSVYYFVLENGNWTMTCGPMTQQEYEEIARKTYRNNRGNGFENMLTKCDFPVKGCPENTLVFMENKSKILFLATPLASANVGK